MQNRTSTNKNNRIPLSQPRRRMCPLVVVSSQSHLLSCRQHHVSLGDPVDDASANMSIGGYVRLNTSNPFDQPLIDPAFLSTDYDVAVMVEAVRASQRYVAASPWKDYIIRPFIDSANTTTVEGIVEYSRQRTATTRHPTGTAQVGKVVDGNLTVKNVNGLRVVDASIFVSPRPLLSAHK